MVEYKLPKLGVAGSTPVTRSKAYFGTTACLFRFKAGWALGLTFFIGVCMARNDLEKRLHELIDPVVESFGLDLWGFTIGQAGHRRVLKIYVDSPNGVNIDQCAQVSRHVGLNIEVEDAIPGAYTLEVSSPGLERVFFSPLQMHAYIGREIDVKLHEALNERKSFHGTITSAADDSFTLDENGERIEFDWQLIKRAKLVHNF